MKGEYGSNIGEILVCLFLISSCTTVSTADSQVSSSSAAAASHLRLIDRLDRPKDGYCIDVLGTGSNLRVNLPVFAHNCKTRLTSDSAVVFNDQGLILVPGVNRCLTIAGVNSVALPGTSVMLRECGESVAYFDAIKLQRFTHRVDGRLELAGAGLCLVVGSQSATTYSSADRWRTLFVDDCGTVEASRSLWEFVTPDS